MLSYSRRVYREPVADAPALDMSALAVMYPGTRRLALTDVSLRVAVGQQLALVGHNGAGKSTLLKAIVGLLPIRSGTLLIYGHPPGASPHRVAYLPQRGEIDWRFPITLQKLVVTGRYAHLGWFKRPSRADWKMTDMMIDQLGLSALRHRQIGQLSGGQQQRALLARALTQEADLLLLDEPLNAVDVKTRAVMDSVLDNLKTQGKTVITATHDLDRLQTDFDAAFYLSDGREVRPPTEAFIKESVSS